MKRIATPYTHQAQIIHWLMATIFILTWLLGFYSFNFVSYDDRPVLKVLAIDLHKNIATTVFFLLCLRVLWRYTHPAPALPEEMPAHLKKISHAVHIVLYMLLLLVPLSGCFYSSVTGHPLPILYLTELSLFAREIPALEPVAEYSHITLTFFAGALVALHIAAALKHHFIDKDEVLLQMIAGKKES